MAARLITRGLFTDLSSFMLRRKQPCSVGDVFAFCWTLYIQAKGQYFFAELACTVFLVLKKIQRSNLKLKSN